jgi:hypothetical protein
MAYRKIEFAVGRQFETRDLFTYMTKNGAPRAVALRAAAAAELRDELPADVDADAFQRLLEQRCQILGSK